MVEGKNHSKLFETASPSELWASRAHCNKDRTEPVVHIFSDQYAVTDWESGTAGRSTKLLSLLSQHITLLPLKGSIGNGPSLCAPAESENGPRNLLNSVCKSTLTASYHLPDYCVCSRENYRGEIFSFKSPYLFPLVTFLKQALFPAPSPETLGQKLSCL